MFPDLEVGVAINDELLTSRPARRRALLDALAGAGLDHLSVGDHVSFHGGTGFDGLTAATTALATHDDLRVVLGVYLAALRHPMVTARAMSTLSQIAPGRLVLGVGVGGEDRSESRNTGVDPATRGRRMDETLTVLRRLASGEAVDHDGEFFRIEQGRILPPPDPRVPVVIGGGGDAAVRRTVEHGDGWLGMWCSARRYAATQDRIREACEAAGRPAPGFAGLSMWVGFGPNASVARARLGERLSSLYGLPAEKFRHVTPAGTPEEVAEFLAGYVRGGARTVSLVPVAATIEEALESSGEVRRLLRGS